MAQPAIAIRPDRVLQGATAAEWKTQDRITVLIGGHPKGAGKTTLALSATKPGERTVVVACDLGRLSIPPGVNREDVLVLPNQELTREMEGGASKPVRDIFAKLTGDLYEVYRSVKEDRALKLQGGKEFPPPQNVVLDGMSRLNAMLVDGQLAVSGAGVADVADLPKEVRFSFWGKRLRNTLTIVEQYASLPCNVFMTTWIEELCKYSGGEKQNTGVWLPDIGGKMDLLTAGTVGAAVLAYSEQGKFKVRTKSNGMFPWCGVRDRYDVPEVVDVTIEGKPGEKSAWAKVLG